MARRLILAVVLVALGVLAGPLAGASAAPSLSISTPEQGGVTNETKPLISGHSSDSSDGVTVTLFAGSTQIESTVVDPELGSGSWAVRFPSELPDGSYLVVAEQLELLTGEGSEAESAFTVFTAKPDVSLNGSPRRRATRRLRSKAPPANTPA